MAQKNDIPVIINGRVYTLSGYESDDYLQQVATYINSKSSECKASEQFRSLNAEYQNMLLAINIADDYFKTKKQASELENEDDSKEKLLYDLRHEILEAHIKNESANKLVDEYKEQVSALQRKIIQLEAEKKRHE